MPNPCNTVTRAKGLCTHCIPGAVEDDTVGTGNTFRLLDRAGSKDDRGNRIRRNREGGRSGVAFRQGFQQPDALRVEHSRIGHVCNCLRQRIVCCVRHHDRRSNGLIEQLELFYLLGCIKRYVCFTCFECPQNADEQRIGLIK